MKLALTVLCLAVITAQGAVVSSSPPSRILHLGDSYTAGEGVPTELGWPAQLAAALAERGVPLERPLVIATTGWTAAELSAGIDRAAPRVPVDLVTLQIGVNDQYRGGTAEAFRPVFVALLERAIGSTGADPRRVIVVSIPDWGVTPFAVERGRDRGQVAAEIDAFNAVCREETLHRGARFVDVTPISREAADNRGLLAGDGLHPSGTMYARWVELILPHALEGLGWR